MTHNGGVKAVEGMDGADIYYTQSSGRGPLWRMPTGGGPPVKVLDDVVSSAFAVVDKGIYYLDRPSGEARLQFLDFATGRSITVARGLGEVRARLTATRDGRTILFCRLDSWLADLMLVRNLR